jgi:RNA polymerase II subunit A C-terminal domain phosphatase
MVYAHCADQIYQCICSIYFRADYVGSDTQRVSINLVHDSKGVMISHKEATRIEAQTAERLLKQKKLSLLLDLDQTVVHATVDTSIGEWLENQDNPNYPKLKVSSV